MKLPSATARPWESLPPNVATTMSGSTPGSFAREFGRPVEEVGAGEAGRHLVVELGVDDVRAVEQRLQVRAERAGVAVADDVHLTPGSRPSVGPVSTGLGVATGTVVDRTVGVGRRVAAIGRGTGRTADGAGSDVAGAFGVGDRIVGRWSGCPTTRTAPNTIRPTMPSATTRRAMYLRRLARRPRRSAVGRADSAGHDPSTIRTSGRSQTGIHARFRGR